MGAGVSPCNKRGPGRKVGAPQCGGSTRPGPDACRAEILEASVPSQASWTLPPERLVFS